MAQKYTHLNHAERKHIGLLRRQKKSLAEIARIMGRHVSTISRELRLRPKRYGYYDSQLSQAHAVRQRKKPRKPQKILGKVEDIVKAWLKESMVSRANSRTIQP